MSAARRRVLWGLLGGAGISTAACTDSGVRPSSILQAADSADQVMFGMSTQVTEKGVRRSFVEADTAFLYQNRQTMDLRHFKVLFLDPEGNPKSTLTARQGFYTSFNNKLDARGDVLVEAVDGGKLRTQHLIYNEGARQIVSDTTFVYDGPQGHITGNGFISDLEFKNVRVEQPKGTQKGKSIVLPGQ
jgi:LPS export ABC transporter protein LptC